MTDRIQGPLAARRCLKRACTNCAAGKAKCTPFSTDECERCHRLGKECRYSPLATRRKAPQKNSRLRTLERKVEELATRQEYTPQRPQGSIARQPLNHGSGVPIIPGVAHSPQTSNGVCSLDDSGIGSNTPSGTVSSTPCNTDGKAGDIVDRGVITQELAQVLLDRFRATAAPQFPFVVIPAESSLEVVRNQTRFLFLAIAATMIFDNPLLQHQLGAELRQQAFQRILLGKDKNLDLLQGLLIYTAWYCHFVQPGIHEEFLLSQLCVTLAHDLGLDRIKSRQENSLCQLNPVSDMESNFSFSNTQMRAYLGTYCISSLVATVRRTRTALSYTKYMHYCCQLLSERKEYITDELIPSFVQSQELLQRISNTFSYDSPENGEIRGEYLLTLTSDAFVRDLDRVRAEVPESFQKSILLDMEFKAIYITINEAALHTEFWCSTNDSQPVNASSSTVARSKMLWRSLSSCQDLICTFLTFQNQDLFYLTAFVCPRLLYAFITLAKLVAIYSENRVAGESETSTLVMPNQDWSIVELANETNFQELAKKVLDKFTAISTDFVGADGRRDSMSNAASAIKMMIAGYEQQIKEIQISLQSRQMSVSEGAISNGAPDTAGSTTYTCDYEIGGGNTTFETDFTFNSPENTFWDDILESFTIVPYL